jgi:hypothetical protein
LAHHSTQGLLNSSVCSTALARYYQALGALFVAVGVDTPCCWCAPPMAAPFLTDYRGTWLELHLMRRIQQALDPLVLINPGKLLKFK